VPRTHRANSKAAITKLPIPGARIGETLITSMSIDISLVASARVEVAPIGAAPPSGTGAERLKMRKAISVVTSLESAQPMLPMVNSAARHRLGSLRPRRYRQRPIEELADAEHDEERHQRRLHRIGAGAQAGAGSRAAPEIHVDGEGSDRGDETQRHGETQKMIHCLMPAELLRRNALERRVVVYPSGPWV